MEELKEQLKKRALRKYKEIKPCGRIDTLDNCFQIVENKLIFWFNDRTNSTRTVSETIKDVPVA